MTILKRDKLMLTTKFDLLCQKIDSNRKNVKSFRSAVSGEDNETGSDTIFSNSNHVQSERFWPRMYNDRFIHTGQSYKGPHITVIIILIIIIIIINLNKQQFVLVVFNEHYLGSCCLGMLVNNLWKLLCVQPVMLFSNTDYTDSHSSIKFKIIFKNKW